MGLTKQSIAEKVFQSLAYYDVFNYPLKFEEISHYSGISNSQDLLRELDTLLVREIIYHLDEFYSLQNDRTLIETRIEGDKRALDYAGQAKSKSRLIAKFPYVKGVFISGSLSKGTMNKDGDIDFFIITSPNRLWIARTLLIFYKKVFLLNSRKYFCINYLIDEETLEIEQKNIFTATELFTLLPMVNNSLYKKLLDHNQWIKQYYSNPPSNGYLVYERGSSLFQKLIEPLLNHSFGNDIDTFFMRLTLKRWRKMFHSMDDLDFDIALKTTKKISKHHPSNFQKKVLKEYQDRIIMLEKLSCNN